VSEDDEQDDAQVEATLDKSTAAAHPMLFISGSAGPSSLRGLLNPISQNPDKQPMYQNPGPGQSRQGIVLPSKGRKGDVITRGIISMDTALRLYTSCVLPGVLYSTDMVASFFASLNPIILLLDPHLHTFDYVRRKSSFL
jgi:hypothetical protein